VAAKSGQFTANETGKGQFLRENRRNLEEEGVVRKVSSPKRVASVSNLCNGRGQWAGNMGKGKCLLRFWRASLPVHFLKVQHNRRPTGSLELHGRRRSRKDPKYPRRSLVGETLIRTDWESVRKRVK